MNSKDKYPDALSKEYADLRELFYKIVQEKGITFTIIDVEGKKEAACSCGFIVKVPDRVLSSEDIEHMKLISKNADEEMKEHSVIYNPRAQILCPGCEKTIMLLTDRFSFLKKDADS